MARKLAFAVLMASASLGPVVAMGAEPAKSATPAKIPAETKAAATEAQVKADTKAAPAAEAPAVTTPATPAGTPVKAETAAADDAKASDTGYGKTRGLLGPVILGPRVTLLGLPRPFSVALEGKTLAGYVGFSVDYGFLPSFSISDIALKFNSIDGRVRLFPFAGAFFIGAALGKQTFGASTTKTISGVSTKVDIDVNTLYLSPMIGWRWVAKSGFFFGMELGYQHPLSYSTTFTDSVNNAAVQATADYQKMVSDVKDKGDTFGQTGLPVFSALQIGFFF